MTHKELQDDMPRSRPTAKKQTSATDCYGTGSVHLRAPVPGKFCHVIDTADQNIKLRMTYEDRRHEWQLSDYSLELMGSNCCTAPRQIMTKSDGLPRRDRPPVICHKARVPWRFFHPWEKTTCFGFQRTCCCGGRLPINQESGKPIV